MRQDGNSTESRSEHQEPWSHPYTLSCVLRDSRLQRTNSGLTMLSCVDAGATPYHVGRTMKWGGVVSHDGDVSDSAKFSPFLLR
jgi:hypothetical protein